MAKRSTLFQSTGHHSFQTREILSLCTSRGAVHDFELFKRNLNQIPTGAFTLRRVIKGIYYSVSKQLVAIKSKEAL